MAEICNSHANPRLISKSLALSTNVYGSKQQINTEELNTSGREKTADLFDSEETGKTESDLLLVLHADFQMSKGSNDHCRRHILLSAKQEGNGQ